MWASAVREGDCHSGIVLEVKKAGMASCEEQQGGSQTSLMFSVTQGKKKTKKNNKGELYREIACLIFKLSGELG